MEWVLPAVVVSVGGAFSPYIVKFFVAKVSKTELRFLISLVLSGVVGFIGVVIMKVDLSFENISQVITGIFTLGQLSYRLWWHKLFNN